MRNSTWPIIAILVVAIILVGGLFYFERQPTDRTRQAVPGVGGGPDDRATVSDIIQNPNQFVARTVTLDGEVDRVISPRMFVFDQMGTAIGDEILIITENQIPQEAEDATMNTFNDADQVTVTGTVNRLLIAEIERDLEIDLDRQLEIEFENRPVIMATDVTVTTAE